MYSLAQAVIRWLLTAEIKVQSQVTSHEIRGGRSGTGAGFFPIYSFSPANHYFTIALHSSIIAARDVRWL
jgi:hypothetical protein